MFSWQDIVKTVAPVIGTAIGGPFGGMASKFALNLMGLSEEASEEEIKKAVQDPNILAKLKSQDQAFKIKMAELGISERQLAAQDRDSARNMAIQTKDWAPKVLAFLITFGFFGLLSMMLFYDLPEKNQIVINIMVGVLGTAFVSIVTYYFGSSAGSKEKTNLMSQK